VRFPSKGDCLAFLKAQGLAPATVIDVGVHAATPELITAFPAARHLLIEPEPAHAPAIARAYAGVDHTLLQCAASDQDGQIQIRSVAKGQGAAITHSYVGGSKDVPEAGGRQVRQARLDTLIAETGAVPPYLVKIDTDGHEKQVLAGAPDTLAQSACVIVEATTDTLSDRLRALERAGLRLFDIIDLAYYFDTLSQVDLVCVNPAVFDPPGLSPWRRQTFEPRQWREFEPLSARAGHYWRRLAGRLLGRS